MQKFNLMTARFPGNSQEHPESSSYIINLMPLLFRDDRIARIDNWYTVDTPIDMVRNLCVQTALDNDVDYLLMIDSDMSPDCVPGAPSFWRTAWEFAMRCRATENMLYTADPPPPEDQFFRTCPPITIAAPYCGPPPVESCYIMKWGSKETGGADISTQLKQFDRDEAARMTGITEVAALPTGLILYDTRVFRMLTPPWFRYEYGDPPYNTRKITTEDVWQTRNASMQGMPQFAAWDCWAAHIKPKLVPKPQVLKMVSMRTEFAMGILRGAGFHISQPVDSMPPAPSPEYMSLEDAMEDHFTGEE